MRINLSEIVEEIKNLIVNSPSEQVVSQLGDLSQVCDADFGAAFGAEGLKGLEAVAKSLGVDYQGKSFEIWQNADDSSIGFRAPSIHTDGVNAVLKWGDQTVQLDGGIGGKLIGTDVRVSTEEATMRIALRLEYTDDAAAMGKVKEQILDCEAWLDLVPFLKTITKSKSRKELFESGIQNIEVLSIRTRTSKAGDEYLSATGRGDNGEVFSFSLPHDAIVLTGDVIAVHSEEKCLTLGTQKFESQGFLKLGDLKVGKPYTVTSVDAKTGEFPGYDLTIPKVGKVSSNSQFTRWFEAVSKAGDVVSVDNPVELTVLSVRPLKNGHNQVKLSIGFKAGKSVGLARLLGKAPAPSSTATASAPKETAAADDWLTNV